MFWFIDEEGLEKNSIRFLAHVKLLGEFWRSRSIMGAINIKEMLLK